ncbi:unnamed protein product [Calicophoron daubneyi]|uniref:Uncharacterized protein n=1 Tax=Calicophoron daubneyi TaxID=300641 RepID=A0AAV2TM99_CALDB
MMKWPFLHGLKLRRESSGRLDGKKAQPRYKKTRLFDLLCTVKNRHVLRDTPDSIDIYSPKECVTPANTAVEPLSDLLQFHSLALRRPVPFCFDDRQALESSHRRVCSAQPAFCPTCHNVVILLPQKRQSFQGSSRTPCVEQSCAKRIRSCLDSAGSPLFAVDKAEWRLDDKRTTVGYFNPTYEPGNPHSEESIYSTVASESTSTDTLSPCSSVGRRKIFGRRTSNCQNTTNKPEASQSVTTSVQSENESNRTYAVFDPFATTNSSLSESSDLFVPGGLWVSSTMKRRKSSCFDNETVYDEVASDFDDALREPPTSAQRGFRNKRRRNQSESPSQPYEAAKRVRREYFVCEE